MGHICLQSDVPVISHKVDGGRSQINHGNWLVQTLDSRYAVCNQIQIHLMIFRHQLVKFRIPHHKTLVKFHVNRIHQITAGQIQIVL